MLAPKSRHFRDVGDRGDLGIAERENIRITGEDQHERAGRPLPGPQIGLHRQLMIEEVQIQPLDQQHGPALVGGPGNLAIARCLRQWSDLHKFGIHQGNRGGQQQ